MSVGAVDGRISVGLLGATGSVGQRMVALLADHPWFRLTTVAASERSAGKRYAEAVRWVLPTPMPQAAAGLIVQRAEADQEAPILFSALDADAAGPLEERHARAGHLVVSNAKSHRMDGDVPLLVPEVNAGHLDLLGRQTFGRGAIVTNPNCSTIGLALVLHPLHRRFGVERALVVTLQAVSGAGMPGVSSLVALDNVIPFIGGEEEKLEAETLKILGTLGEGGIAPAPLVVSAQCNRVPVVDGHTLCVSVSLRGSPTLDDIRDAWETFEAEPQRLALPSAPPRPVIFVDGDDVPQPRLHRDAGRGMASTVGRLRHCALLGYKFVTVTHNTVRGAAGGAILCAELVVAQQRVPGLEVP